MDGHIAIEDLLARAGWIESLAHSLADDSESALDIVQDTYLAALENKPRLALRAWVRRVVRNLVLRARRGESRRLRREARAARLEVSPESPERLVERLELHRAVADAVLGLVEPGRTTVLLRFFEGLTPAEIARRQGIPATTVRSRLSAALEKLRTRLDREFGGGRTGWLAAVAALPRLPGILAAAKGVLAVRIVVAAVLVAALGASGLWAFRHAVPRDGGRRPPAPSEDVLGFDALGLNAQGYTEYRHRETGIVFVRLPGGRASIGSADGERGARPDEQPRHEAVLGPFLIAKHEVSQAEWRRAMGTEPSAVQGDRLPVTSVSWLDCQSFCQRTGLSLPTEAQWEYACRAGTETAFAFAPDLAASQAHLAGDRPVPAGSFPPNGFGLHDMHGNVAEWCEDEYDPGFYREDAARAVDPVRGKGFWDQDRYVDFMRAAARAPRVIRGGSFQNRTDPEGISETKDLCRSAARSSRPSPSWGDGGTGFRPVRSLRIAAREAALDVAARGAMWSEVREEVTAMALAGDKEAAPLITALAGRPAPALALAGMLAILSRAEGAPAREIGRHFLVHGEPAVRARAALLLVRGGGSSAALSVLRILLARERGSELNSYDLAELADGLMDAGEATAREAVEVLFEGFDLAEKHRKVMPWLVRRAAQAGIPDGLRCYRRLLDVRGNRLGSARFADDVSVAQVFASEIAEHYAPEDPEVAALRERTAFDSDERVAWLQGWLEKAIRALESRSR